MESEGQVHDIANVGAYLGSIELFRCRDLCVRSSMGLASPYCVITFDSYTDTRILDRPGFGELFFLSLGINAVHVISRDNDWYQYPEIEDACAVISAKTQGFDGVISYGSSMGGYAAIRLGRLAGAQKAIAISPQFSIDPTVVPFEHRWDTDATRIDFSSECTLKDQFVDLSYIIYDPTNLDRKHVDLYRPHTNVFDIRIPNSGHPAGGLLAETRLLKSTLLDLFSDKFELSKLRNEIRHRRQSSPQFFVNLSARGKLESRRVAFAERAHRMMPNNVRYATHYGLVLAKAGRFAQAYELFDFAIRSQPDDLVVLYRASEFLEMAGDIENAIAITELVLAVQPDLVSWRTRHICLQELKCINFQNGPAGMSGAIRSHRSEALLSESCPKTLKALFSKIETSLSAT